MPVAMGQVTARTEGHPHDFLVHEELAHLFILFYCEIIDRLFAEPLHFFRLDPVDQDGPKGDKISVGS